jgi:hypothetical protein
MDYAVVPIVCEDLLALNYHHLPGLNNVPVFSALE